MATITKADTHRPVQKLRSGAPAASGVARLDSADALRALATFAVVVVHTSHWPLRDTGADDAVWSALDSSVRFCVPAFVVLSGLLLGLRGGAREAPGRFLRRRLRRTLLPFVVWAPVYCLAGLWWTKEVAATPFGVMDWWSGGAGHLYFLVLLPQLYLVFLLWPRGVRPVLTLAVAAMALQLTLETLRLAAPMPGPIQTLMLWKGYVLFPFWIGYFAAGVAAGRLLARDPAAGDHPRAAVACLGAVVVALWALIALPVQRLPHADFTQGTGAFLRPLLVPVVLALCGAALFGTTAPLRRIPRVAAPVRVLSRDSLGVYILHPLIAYWIGVRIQDSLLQQHLPRSIAGVALLTAATLVLALLVTRLLSLTPLAPLIGAERPRRRRSAADHDEGDELLGAGHRPVVAHHPGLRRVD